MESRRESEVSNRSQIHFALLTVTWVFSLSTALSVRAEEQSTFSLRSVGGWTVIETSNFRCRCQLPEADARRLAECCEAWRGRLRKMWITDPDVSNWVPKCEVCVYPDKAAYNAALKRPGDSSVGSTMMNFDQGRTVLRRIDVRADASDWSNAALPHELTHVVLGERFGGHALPRWADEGIAMLSESQEKHRERLVNLRENLSRNQTIRLDQLVAVNRLPAPHLRDAFYGQSVALTSLLVGLSTPARFADFIEQSQRQGIDRALTEQYKIDGVTGLQRQWDRLMRSPDSIIFVSLQLHDGLSPIVAAVTNRAAGSLQQVE